ncbi:type II toxin-antitoxin system Phd/YefM family antitoxin [Acidisoma sp. 7E03]
MTRPPEKSFPVKVRSPDGIRDHCDGQEHDVDGDQNKVSLATAKAHLSALIERAAAGEPVTITRRGEAVAQLTAVGRQRQPVSLAALRAVTAGMPPQIEPADAFVRRMRGNDRY